MRFQKKRPRGLTLTEMMVGMAIFGMLMVVTAMTLRRSTTVWERASGSTTSQGEMRKGHAALLLDLERTEIDTVRRSLGPVSLVGRDGDAVWFLSPIDPVSGAPMRTADGLPFWQRNILYYTVVPSNHQSLYGFSCAGGVDTQGYEDRCPHKMLIRKVIDFGAPTDTSDETKPETLITNIGPYLTRPNGFNLSGMVEPGLEDAQIKAQSLLSFRVGIGSNPQWPGEVMLDLRSVRIEEARRLARIGSAPLDTWMQQFTFSVFPPVSAKH